MNENAPRADGLPPTPEWERKLLDQFAFAALREQRLARRWGIFFKFLAFAYVLAFIALSIPQLGTVNPFGADKITALIDVQGVIAQDSDASADMIITGLRAAFENKSTAGVIIRINSPGGSPVQAGYINDEIYRLKENHPETKVYAVIQDICASGGYYVAAAADEIYADKASIVGSIGVRMDSFGFVEAIEKIGVERRLLTAGEHKGFLDPFLPLDKAEVMHVSGLLGEIHQQFINTVLKGRRNKIHQSPELFSGLVWTGENALKNGLVDALGSAGYVAREIIKAEDIVDFTPKRGVFDQVAKRFGTEFSSALKTLVTPSW
ncbi:MAG: S49 family peptidase [Gammaproteobacteria bacterium]|nr:S49 family peptidase [Gammaproteobacteria bacterium]